MLDKSSIFNKANKFASKGQIDKAIAEWEKLLQKKKDGNIYNNIGDLYLKKGSEKEAVESFSNAAEYFKRDGFFPKAIAIYKKILNIIPNNVDALIALAKLNAEKGLKGNAAENYFKAAEIFQRDGATEKTLKVIDKILQLSPTDSGSKTKIAELFFKCGHRERAAGEYSELASMHLRRENFEKAEEFYQKAITLDSENIQALTGLGRAAEKKGDLESAFGYTEKALSLDPHNKDTLTDYTNVSIKAGKTDTAKKTLRHSLEKDPSDIIFRKLLGTIHLYEGKHEEAWEDLSPCIDEAVNSQDWQEALELLNNFRDSHKIEAAERIISVLRASGDNDALVHELKELVNTYESEGKPEEALNACQEILKSNPGDNFAEDKVLELKAMLGIEGPPAEPVQEEPSEYVAADESKKGKPPQDDMMSELLMTTHETPQEEIPDQPVESLITDKLPETNEADGEVQRQQESSSISPEDFAEKKAEADFFARQGLNDEALNIYKNLLSERPDDNEIKEKIDSLGAGGPGSGEAPEQEPGGEQDEESSVDSDLKDLFNTFGEDNTDTEDISRTNSKEENISESENENTKQEPDQQAAAASSVDSDLKDLFNKFGDSADTDASVKEGNSEDDYEAHYTSGLELKQKGLLDDAVREFRISAHDPEKKVLSLNMIASCYMDKGAYPHAITEYHKIIDTLSPDDRSYLLIKYELAGAYTKNGDYDKALELYIEIQALDPEYKDVSRKVEDIRSMPRDSETTPKSKKNRVSYI